jgi:Kef-type K+ transport system membrane component KefB
VEIDRRAIAESLVIKFVAVLATSACTVALAKRLELSPIFGYLLAGFIIPTVLACSRPTRGRNSFQFKSDRLDRSKAARIRKCWS